jgi:hypothetical protein
MISRMTLGDPVDIAQWLEALGLGQYDTPDLKDAKALLKELRN